MDSVQRKGAATLENEANSFRSALRLHTSTRMRDSMVIKARIKAPWSALPCTHDCGMEGGGKKKERESERVGRHLIHR